MSGRWIRQQKHDDLPTRGWTDSPRIVPVGCANSSRSDFAVALMLLFEAPHPKSRTASSREASNTQAPNDPADLSTAFESWSLELLWDLGVGAWNLPDVRVRFRRGS